jgi:hypothetical protein
MMPIFTLNLYNGNGWLPETEGQDFKDVASAVGEAIYGIRDLVAGEIKAGVCVNLGHFIEIRDEAERLVRRIHFREAVRFVDEPDASGP